MIYIGFVSRMLLALIFLAAAGGKSTTPGSLSKTIRAIGIPSVLAPLATWLVLACEGILGVLFALGAFPVVTSIAAALLLLIFIGISIQVTLSHRTIPCNCFGKSDTSLGAGTLLRAFLLLLTVSTYALSIPASTSAWWPTTLESVVSLSTCVIGALLLGRWLLIAKGLTTLVIERHHWDQDVRQERLAREEFSAKFTKGGM
jgi:hypothetical protein